MPNPRWFALGACVLWIASAALEPAAEAAVFRCTEQGRALYTDRPCRAGEMPYALPWLGVVPAGRQADLAAEHDARRERMLDSRQRDDQAWREAHSQRRARDQRIQGAIRGKRTAPGMSADEVRRALGRPDAVKRDHNGGERWTYRDGRKQKTVRLANGRVVGDERKPAKAAKPADDADE
ncbi:MAG: hypothetical protein K0Q76_1046 [Panacagrimonas sp.]|jgi:hypothetical protein|nr:hypothetical protein [Panacagrimonas sp.]MCC2655938.1 hypothetical protein [Panacagrimonas sp.]